MTQPDRDLSSRERPDPGGHSKIRQFRSTRASDEDGHIWCETDLAPAWLGERTEPPATVLPRSDGLCLIAPGINYLFGDSGDGKSWLALIAAVGCMRKARHVAWVTYEDANELELVNRLKLLGVGDDDLKHLSVYIASAPLPSGIRTLGHLVRSRQTDLVVFDSVGEALAIDGVDEDRDADFAPWARGTFRLLLDIAGRDEWHEARDTLPNRHVSLLPIDHATKSKDRSLFPSGTKRKRAMVTAAMFMLKVVQPLGVDVVGRVRLVAAKDRRGRFRRGEEVAEIVLDATCAPYRIAIESCMTTAPATRVRRTAQDRVLAVVLAADSGLDAPTVRREVNRVGNRRPTESELALGTIKNALTELAGDSRVCALEQPTGVGGGSRNLYSVRAVGQSKDDDANGL